MQSTCPVIIPLATKISAVTPIKEARPEITPSAPEKREEVKITAIEVSHSDASKRDSLLNGLVIFIRSPQ